MEMTERIRAVSMVLSTAVQAADRLLIQYGPERLRRVEALDRRRFRACLSDGGIALVTVHEDGSAEIRELKECPQGEMDEVVHRCAAGGEETVQGEAV